MAYRPEWWPVNKSLVELSLELHMTRSGASDSGTLMAREALEHAITYWRSPSSSFDLAVQTLIMASLEEQETP